MPRRPSSAPCPVLTCPCALQPLVDWCDAIVDDIPRSLPHQRRTVETGSEGDNGGIVLDFGGQRKAAEIGTGGYSGQEARLAVVKDFGHVGGGGDVVPECGASAGSNEDVRGRHSEGPDVLVLDDDDDDEAAASKKVDLPGGVQESVDVATGGEGGAFIDGVSGDGMIARVHSSREEICAEVDDPGPERGGLRDSENVQMGTPGRPPDAAYSLVEGSHDGDPHGGMSRVSSSPTHAQHGTVRTSPTNMMLSSVFPRPGTWKVEVRSLCTSPCN